MIKEGDLCLFKSVNIGGHAFATVYNKRWRKRLGSLGRPGERGDDVRPKVGDTCIMMGYINGRLTACLYRGSLIVVRKERLERV